jgi:signal transduction histidine kinase
MIAVSDTGIGIDPIHLDVVFEPFMQVSSYETRQHPGAGLGLSITKQLVELHGGRIDVVSKVGVGSCFQVFIPTIPKLTPMLENLSTIETQTITTDSLADGNLLN